MNLYMDELSVVKLLKTDLFQYEVHYQTGLNHFEINVSTYISTYKYLTLLLLRKKSKKS